MRAKDEGLTPAGDVVLTLLSDEEYTSNYGARYLVENHAYLFEGIHYAIGEFGGFTFYIGKRRFYPIMVAEKQLCVLEATVRGPGGHSLRPHHGGTMANLSRLLRRLDYQHMTLRITPAARKMIESISSALPFPLSVILRQLLNPKLSDRVLKL